MADPNAVPRFPKTTVSVSADLSTGNSNLDGTTGVYATVYTSPTTANGGVGSRIDVLGYKFRATSTSGMIRWFLDDKLILEQDVAAVTVGATTKAAAAFVDKTDPTDGFIFPVVMQQGQVLKASTENGELSTVFAQGGEF